LENIFLEVCRKIKVYIGTTKKEGFTFIERIFENKIVRHFINKLLVGLW
jgi:hypothetical protein